MPKGKKDVIKVENAFWSAWDELSDEQQFNPLARTCFKSFMDKREEWQTRKLSNHWFVKGVNREIETLRKHFCMNESEAEPDEVDDYPYAESDFQYDCWRERGRF